MSAELIERTTALADDVLFPKALETDAADVLPEENLDALADLGLYGIFAPQELGGLGDAKELADKHPAFAEVATARGVSPQQVALAWELAQSPVVIPIPGAKRPQSITDSAAAADLELTAEELARLDG